ncbi:unnamed protein product [Sympodiomycopsis kandeliae]
MAVTSNTQSHSFSIRCFVSFLSPCLTSTKTSQARSTLMSEASTSIWLDADPGHDDAIALLVAMFAPSRTISSDGEFEPASACAALTLLGISAVGGNAPVHATFANAARLLEFFNAPLASGPDDFESGGVHLLMGAADPLVKRPRCDPDIHGEDGLGGVTGLPPLRSASVQRRAWASYVKVAEDDSGSTSEGLMPEASPAELLIFWHKLLKHRISMKLPKMTIVATGPLTNVALLIKAFPKLVDQGVKEIVIMGGVEGQRGNRGPLAEFNILVDPEAASIVFNHDIKVVMAGLNVTHQAIFTPSLMEKLLSFNLSTVRGVSYEDHQPVDSLCAHSDPGASQTFRKTIASILTFFAETYESEFGFKDGPPVHDVLAVAYVVDPTLFWKSEDTSNQASKGPGRSIPPPRYNVQVECAENSLALGATVADVYCKPNPHPDTFWGRDGKNVEVLDTVDTDRLWQLFFACVERAEKHKLGQSTGIL